jgi:hypothetical protein
MKPDRMVVTKDKEVFYWIIKQAFMILNIKKKQLELPIGN